MTTTQSTSSKMFVRGERDGRLNQTDETYYQTDADYRAGVQSAHPEMDCDYPR